MLQQALKASLRNWNWHAGTWVFYMKGTFPSKEHYQMFLLDVRILVGNQQIESSSR